MKKLLAMLLALAMVLSVVAGSVSTASLVKMSDVVYEREDDEEVYNRHLSEYAELLAAAEGSEDVNERFVLMAQAEAALLDSAVMIPNTTQGGAFTISRVAPRTVPYVQWGNDDDRLKGLIISDEFLTPEERNDLLDMWAKACAGECEYDPAGYLTSKGHTIQNTYTTTFSTKRLRENGYITMDRDGLITLTDSGMAIAQQIYDRHRTLTDFLIRLGVSETAAAEDACRIEHDISQETFDAICRHVRGKSGKG